MTMYEEGKQSFDALLKSPLLRAWVADPMTVKAEDAMKLFLPCEEQPPLQMRTPHSPVRQDWLRGFEERRQEVLADS